MKKSVRAENKDKSMKTVTNKGISFKTVTYEKIVDYAKVTHKGNSRCNKNLYNSSCLESPSSLQTDTMTRG